MKLKIFSLCISILFIAFLVACQPPTGSIDTPNPTNSTASITITAPTENALITAPLVIEGQARGTWFFEASFPIILLDENDNVLAQTTAQAQDDWMTEDFVPFTAQIDAFSPGESSTGILRFQKDNPSGLPENDASFDLPVQLTETTTMTLYFSNQLDEGLNCNEPWPIQRTITKTDNLPLTALEELLKGPTSEDTDRDYFTNINPNVTIQSFKIENGIAYVDFDETLEQAIAGSCRVGAIRAQIEQTLLQFPEITQVQISINGRTEDILQP